jgi:hypothetical protein
LSVTPLSSIDLNLSISRAAPIHALKQNQLIRNVSSTKVCPLKRVPVNTKRMFIS